MNEQNNNILNRYILFIVLYKLTNLFFKKGHTILFEYIY